MKKKDFVVTDYWKKLVYITEKKRVNASKLTPFLIAGLSIIVISMVLKIKYKEVKY